MVIILTEVMWRQYSCLSLQLLILFPCSVTLLNCCDVSTAACCDVSTAAFHCSC